MAAPLILVSRSPGERRVAWLREGRFHRYRVERLSAPEGVGDLHRGRVTTHVPAMAGAFVALPEDGFLPESEAPGRKIPPEGTILPLRVTRAAQGGKGKRVSARDVPTLPPGPVGLVESGPDAALRFAAAEPEARILTDGAAESARLAAALGRDRVRLVPRAFGEAEEAEAETLAGSAVALPGGGRLLIHPLPALTAMDVDGGEATAARDRGALRSLNEAAIAEAARQIALRDLAGPILLDLAGLSPAQREGLLPAMRRALAADPLTELLGLGPLGLIELRRRRVLAPLHEVLAGPLARGHALLRRALWQAAAEPAAALTLCAPGAILDALRAEGLALREYAEATGRPISLRAEAQEDIARA
ncbi:MAG: ribonuclease E/G [Acetobacteraceae bacterium]|nr:ribonuclease E/G [Acetobacteraceae bacterium]